MATKTTCMSSQGSDDEQRKRENIRSLTMSGRVGFESLPDQLVNRSIQQGFCFNILCVGETGIGKSTLIDTLFNTNFEDYGSSHFCPNVKLKAQTYELQESNVQLKLTIVNTVGFGDQINKEESYQPIVDYIDDQFEAYFQEELKIKRSLFTYHDSRIHVCLYFISPTGHSLKTLDLLTVKNLDSKVNIIPVIAKADTVSKTELQKFKIKFMSELVSNGVQIYQSPTDDDTIAKVNAAMNGQLPFAVVGSTDEVKVGNEMVKARQYPWGVVQVENENHYTFRPLPGTMSFTGAANWRKWALQMWAQKTSWSVFKRPMKPKDVSSMVNKLRELQAKFEHLKRLHQEERMKLDEKRRLLEEEIIAFSKKKATSEIFHSQSFLATGSNLRKDNDPSIALLCADEESEFSFEAKNTRLQSHTSRAFPPTLNCHRRDLG
uniref:Septin n=1 Tax=Nomascus leucogenys TaxID=61853 RepID=A0A2I3HYT2_NOMLE